MRRCLSFVPTFEDRCVGEAEHHEMREHDELELHCEQTTVAGGANLASGTHAFYAMPSIDMA